MTLSQGRNHPFLSAVFPRRLKATLATFGCVAGIACIPTISQAAPPAGLTLSWSDEFHVGVGNKPDTSKWSWQTGRNNANQEQEIYVDDTEHTHIVADPNATDGQALQILSTNDGGVYHSARISTGGRHDFQYGFIESRIRLPYGQGMWPAFWMLGSNIGQVGWPACGEVDIMENIGLSSWYSHNQASLHSRRATGGTFDFAAGYDLRSARFQDGYHLFQCWWQPDSISFYIDGNLYETHTRAEYGDNSWPFDKPLFILLNVAVGGNWPGLPDATTVFPQKMLVDYVRVYTGTPRKPLAPTHVTAAPAEGKQIALTWKSDMNATSFNLYRSTKPSAMSAAPYKTGLSMLSFVDTGLTPHTRYYYRIAAVNTAGKSTLSTVVSAVAPPMIEKPFTGTPATIPGRIEFANYDRGGEGLAYHDTDPENQGGAYRPLDGVDIQQSINNTYNIGFTAAGEWLKYTVKVARTGTYLANFRVAADGPGGSFHLEDESGQNLTGPINVANTGGWQKWTSVSATLRLRAGKHVLNLVEDTGGYNLLNVDFQAR